MSSGIRKFGLIGYPLDHSFSPEYFRNKFHRESIQHCQYLAYPIQHIEEVQALLADPDLAGLNVTIPYKQAIIPFLDELSLEASAMGAVNTLVKKSNRWVGHNTDFIGFKQSLPIEPDKHKKVLILGTGGSSKAVAYAFSEMGIDIVFVSRQKSGNNITYQEITASLLEETQYIVNTTPLGMYPDSASFPDIPYHHLRSSHICYDLVYNPAETSFMAKSRQQGALVQNGYAMLIAQAEAAWELWNY